MTLTAGPVFDEMTHFTVNPQYTYAATQFQDRLNKLIASIEHTSFKLANWQMQAIAAHQPLPSTAATPRDVTRAELLAAFQAVVGRHGTDFIATSHSTNATGGVRCIQGEVMLELGFPADQRLPAASDGVATLMGLQDDVEAYSLLEEAETRNDLGRPWGEILAKAEHTLAA